MQNKKHFSALSITFCLLLMIAFAFAPQSVYAEEAPFEGSGTESDPYLIADYEDLCKLSELIDNEYSVFARAHYLQTANIIANKETFSLNKNGLPLYNGKTITLTYDDNNLISGAEEVKLWFPIKTFFGSYDGNGFSISGLYIHGNTYEDAGFILYTAEEAYLKDIHLTNSAIYSPDEEGGVCGGISAYSQNTTYENCISDVLISSYRIAGGICGESSGSTYINCENKGTVLTRTETSSIYSYEMNCGGICGNAYNGNFSLCTNSGNVDGDIYVGGICGISTEHSDISLCENEGTISGRYNIGGIAGKLSHMATANINQGTVKGIGIIGGICGDNSASIIQCYNLGEVTVIEKPSYYDNMMGCGGICGKTSGGQEIAGCANLGKVNGTDIPYTGGICGTGNPIIMQCANLGNISSNTTTGGILGKALETAVVAYCFNTGNISAKGFAGGILGDLYTGWYADFSRYYLDENYVFSCYNTGNIRSTQNYAGGIAGSQINYTVDNCYYLDSSAPKAIATDIDNTAVAKAKSSAQIKNKAFVSEINAGENLFKYDDLNENDGYPMLLALSQMPFSDVPANAYYFDAVLWAVNNGITNGMGNGTFGNDLSCTRAQFVTFLWRAAGEPEPQATSCNFVDCDPNQYYYPAVLWAVENGVTDGTSSTTFSPDKTVNRAEVITFLWKYDGKPAATGNEQFTDVNNNDWFSEAVKWGYANGLAKGMSDTLYGAMDNCTRAQTVTFLYRYFTE